MTNKFQPKKLASKDRKGRLQWQSLNSQKFKKHKKFTKGSGKKFKKSKKGFMKPKGQKSARLRSAETRKKFGMSGKGSKTHRSSLTRNKSGSPKGSAFSKTYKASRKPAKSPKNISKMMNVLNRRETTANIHHSKKSKR